MQGRQLTKQSRRAVLNVAVMTMMLLVIAAGAFGSKQKKGKADSEAVITKLRKRRTCR